MLEQARDDLLVAGECMLAYRRGDPESEEALVGAILESEFMHMVVSALTKK